MSIHSVFTWWEATSYVATLLALALIAAIWGLFRQRRLRHAIWGQAVQLREQRALLQALHDNVPMAMTVVETGPGGPRVISMNRQAGLLYAVDPAAAVGKNLDVLASPDARDHLGEIAAQPISEGPNPPRETPFGADRRVLQVTCVPLAPASPGASRICVLAEDITARKQMDAEIAQSRKLRAVGELVGGIAHEFNNLLTPIMLKVGEIQLDRANDGALQRDIQVIAQAVQRTAELTRRLLTFGRKTEQRVEAVDLEGVVASCFDLLKHTVDRRISWESEVPAGLPPLYLNATDLNQILLNLLLNARDTLLEKLERSHDEAWKPVIRVEAEGLPPGAASAVGRRAGQPPLGWQRLTVRDTGLGMAPEILERIFEPFFTTKDVGQGTGLGLATVWHLVADAGGRISADSIPGSGSSFHVMLPVWPANDASTAPDHRLEPIRTARVLLVEDEPLVAQALMEILRRDGHRVEHILDGAGAWRHLEHNLTAYDLLIIDVNLPGLNGVEIVSRLRERNYGGRVLIMSGRFATSDLRAFARLKIDHALTKPFTIQEFEAALLECLGAGRPAPPDELASLN